MGEVARLRASNGPLAESYTVPNSVQIADQNEAAGAADAARACRSAFARIPAPMNPGTDVARRRLQRYDRWGKCEP